MTASDKLASYTRQFQGSWIQNAAFPIGASFLHFTVVYYPLVGVYIIVDNIYIRDAPQLILYNT